ncbi:MAG: ArsR family transcriptional regulator [Candidatus Micrarchaeota archaeon]
MKTLFISNAKRQTLLSYLLTNPSESLKVRQIAKHLRLTPGFVSVFLKKMAAAGLMKGGMVALSSPGVRARKILINVESIVPLLPKLAKSTGAKGIGLYGSLSRGEDMAQSDADIWIKADRYPDAVVLAKATESMGKELGRSVSILVLTPEKLVQMRKTDPSMFFALAYSFHLWGERLD